MQAGVQAGPGERGQVEGWLRGGGARLMQRRRALQLVPGLVPSVRLLSAVLHCLPT